jgi:hypothetical protein
VTVKTRVRDTSETVVVDTEVQYQRHWTLRVHKVGRQVYIPTMSTPTFSNVFRLVVKRGTEKVNQLFNHPVLSLFGTRMSGTSVYY